MLSEIIKAITDKTGISQENASSAVSIVVNAIKQKLPAPIATQIDSILGGGGVSGAVDAAKGAVGSLFSDKGGGSKTDA